MFILFLYFCSVFTGMLCVEWIFRSDKYGAEQAGDTYCLIKKWQLETVLLTMLLKM